MVRTVTLHVWQSASVGLGWVGWGVESLVGWERNRRIVVDIERVVTRSGKLAENSVNKLVLPLCKDTVGPISGLP